MKIEQYLSVKKKKIDKELDKLLPKSSKSDSLVQAMRYSVFSGGKRLRPILTLEGAKIVGGEEKKVMNLACAVEFIHSFSLIHDDLPCMDNDDYRRGKLSCHRVFGEALALLAGDAFLNQSYVRLARGYQNGDFSKEIFAKLVSEFSKAIGEKGLIGGQMKDLCFKDKRISLKNLEKIYFQKTAVLFILAVRVGAIATCANRKYLANLSEFAKNFGLAFQIIDDCSDSQSDTINYLRLMNRQSAKRKAEAYIEEAKNSLKSFGRKAEYLKKIADFIIKREF